MKKHIVKNYTALWLPYAYENTKSGFRTIAKAEAYITEKMEEFGVVGKRCDWLIINTDTLSRHLTTLEQEEYAHD